MPTDCRAVPLDFTSLGCHYVPVNFCQQAIAAILRQAAKCACLAGCLMASAPSILPAEPLRFASAEATFHRGDEKEFLKVIDGVETGPGGWSPAPKAYEPQALVLRCERPAEAAELDITLFFLAGRPLNPLAEFSLAFTTDEVPSL